jgi:biotin synthase
MPSIDAFFEKDDLTQTDIGYLLSIQDRTELKRLFDHAYRIKVRTVGTTVYLRGLIELSNICEKNCFYCGIRKDNRNVERYFMREEEILKAAEQAWQLGYGSVVLQAGEINSDKYTRFIEKIIRTIKKISKGELGITLSLGEQTEETYRRWCEAGAHRYLLRIETSDRELYQLLHPASHSYGRRIECLQTLKDISYYVGTGVMIGLPGQTTEHLARDIIFFKEIDADMIGMGPYLPHHDTPLAEKMNDKAGDRNDQLDLALRMIAVTRIVLGDVNIAATTALQSIDDYGRERGLMAGANIIMPNMTEITYRKDYLLYDNKPCIDETAPQCRDSLGARIHALGETIGYNQRGESPHYFTRRHSSRLSEVPLLSAEL